jgi:hypothetical protein
MSVDEPDQFDEKVMLRLIKILNEQNTDKSDASTKTDVLRVFGNLATHKERRAELMDLIMDVGEWFETYIQEQEGGHHIPSEVRMLSDVDEPRLHMAMLTLLARCNDYTLKSTDLLELTNGDTVLGLAIVVGILEEGYTCFGKIQQRRAPSEGKKAQWEHGVVFKRHETELVLQLCRLLRGFTHPSTYFKAAPALEAGGSEQLPYSVEEFRMKVNQLLALTLDAEMVDKVVAATTEALFSKTDLSTRFSSQGGMDSDPDGDSDEDGVVTLNRQEHMAILSVHSFLHNLYLYANQAYLPLYRQHLLLESQLISDLILPYLSICLRQASTMCDEQNGGPATDEGEEALLVQGIGSCLKMLVIATFRVPWLSSTEATLWKLSGHTLLVACGAFLQRHEAILAMLMLFDINIGAFDAKAAAQAAEASASALAAAFEASGVEPPDQAAAKFQVSEPAQCQPQAILAAIATVYKNLTKKQQQRVLFLLEAEGQLPVARDVPSYDTAVSLLYSIYDPGREARLAAEAGDAAAAAEGEAKAVAGGEAKAEAKAEAKKAASAAMEQSEAQVGGDGNTTRGGQCGRLVVLTAHGARSPAQHTTHRTAARHGASPGVLCDARGRFQHALTALAAATGQGVRGGEGRGQAGGEEEVRRCHYLENRTLEFGLTYLPTYLPCPVPSACSGTCRCWRPTTARQPVETRRPRRRGRRRTRRRAR